MRTEPLQDLRGLMFSIAYRMTGSVTDAEHIVQEAFVRLERTRRQGVDVESPRAWLSAVTTRIAIDHLRSARRARERYIGPWLPEPLVEDRAPGPAEQAETADSLSQAFLVLLETLSPVERAVFLLHDVFGYEYPDVAEAVGKAEDNCRQIASRARKHVEARRPRFATDPERSEELLERFLAASETGDVDGLRNLLAADAVLWSDGGGKAVAARRPIYGADRVARCMVGVTRKRLSRARPVRQRRIRVNGQPGNALIEPDGSIFSVLTIDVADDQIQAVRIMRNPDKLAHIRFD
jgi:RNA polymerase sigma-70 factor (ECF subfamily)